MRMRKKYSRNSQTFYFPENRNLQDVDLSSFPLVEDFFIVPHLGQIEEWKENRPHLVGALFCSQSTGYLFGGPWWESIFYLNRIQPQFTVHHIPMGTFKNPYLCREFNWQGVIFEHDKYIHILGSPLSVGKMELFSTWFRVNTWNYTKAWLEVFSKLKMLRNEKQ